MHNWFASKFKEINEKEKPKISKAIEHMETDKTKEFESNILALNRCMFSCLLLSMFTVNFVVFVYLGTWFIELKCTNWK
jgi:hypothetical protein